MAFKQDSEFKFCGSGQASAALNKAHNVLALSTNVRIAGC